MLVVTTAGVMASDPSWLEGAWSACNLANHVIWNDKHSAVPSGTLLTRARSGEQGICKTRPAIAGGEVIIYRPRPPGLVVQQPSQQDRLPHCATTSPPSGTGSSTSPGACWPLHTRQGQRHLRHGQRGEARHPGHPGHRPTRGEVPRPSTSATATTAPSIPEASPAARARACAGAEGGRVSVPVEVGFLASRNGRGTRVTECSRFDGAAGGLRIGVRDGGNAGDVEEQ